MQKSAFFLIASSFASVLGGQAVSQEQTKTAIFAGGCFWCVEKDFEHVEGVLYAESGYTGGDSDNPTYKNHTTAKHLEAVRITYDPAKVNYDQLLNVFWRSVNPTDAGGQFCDRGHSYTTAIYALDEMQLALAEASKKAIDESGSLSKPIVTPVIAASKFYLAEDYHQDYYKKNPIRYGYYRRGCRRDATIKALWGEEAHAGINY